MDTLWLSRKLMGGSKNFLLDLSYLMGIMVGDGFAWISNKKRDYGIGLRVTDEPFAISFKRCLERLGFKTTLGLTHTQIGTRLYQVRTRGKEVASWFKQLTLDKIRLIIGEDRDKKIAFIRGFYESEGTVGYNYKLKNQRPSGLKARMGCADKEIVFYVNDLLNSLSYRTNISTEGRGSRYRVQYRINIQTDKQVRRFFNEINPSIKRTVKLPRTQRQKDRIKTYERALELYSKGFTNTEIMREIGVPDNTIHYWVKGVNKPRGLDRPEVVIL